MNAEQDLRSGFNTVMKSSENTDFLSVISKSDNAIQFATNEVHKYNELSLQAQSQIGKELVVDNSNLRLGMQIMADVMRDLEFESDEVKLKLQATEEKLGRKLTVEELDEYRNLRKLTLSTSEMVNKRLLQKCKAKLQPKYK